MLYASTREKSSAIKPRLRYLLTQINVSGRSSLTDDNCRKVIEDRWADIITYYKNLPNVDAVV